MDSNIFSSVWVCLWLVLQLVPHADGVGRWDVFATKTLYKWAHGDQTPVISNEYNHVGVGNTLCKAMHVNMVVRHGARYPTLKNLNKIKVLHEKIMKSKDPGKFPQLHNWAFRYNLTLEAELVSGGIAEQNDLGNRVGTRFHHLFDTNAQYVRFVSSRKSRAKDSAKYFYNGLLDVIKKIPSFENEINNHTMRFYDGCYNYETQVEDNVTHFKQFHDFSKTPEFINIAKALRNKLGIEFSLTEDDVYQIYELCAYEAYIYGETMWCDLLTDAERQVLEYGQDLEKYYESSYGQLINSEMACPLIRDMFQTMDAAINSGWDYDNPRSLANTTYLSGKFQFGHAETLVPLMTALGLYKPSQPMLATNFQSMVGRTFRTSNIVPYSANLAFVVYACEKLGTLETQGSTSGNQEFVVKLFVNEKETNIPACDGWLCYYDKVRQQYADYIEKCNIKEVCGTTPGNKGGNSNPENKASISAVDSCALMMTIVTVAMSSLWH